MWNPTHVQFTGKKEAFVNFCFLPERKKNKGLNGSEGTREREN